MAGDKIRFGLIGTGGIGTVHARSIQQNPEAELAAYFDANSQMMASAREKFPEATACKTLDQLLKTPGLKAVVVATPNNVHAKIAIAAAKKGINVLCEKPLAMDPREAGQMLAAVKQNKVVGMTNFSYRWVPSFRFTRDLIREGRFGKIARLHIKYLQSWLLDPNGPLLWRNLKKIAGFGALGDLGSHMIDAACFVTGAKPKRVVGVHNIHMPTKIDPATGKPAKITADTDAQFMVDFGSFVGMFETSQVEPAHGNHLVVSIGAEHGTCRLYSEDHDGFEIALGAPYADNPTWTTSVPRISIPSTRMVVSSCIPDFVAAIQGKLKDYPSFEDGCTVQNVLDAIFRSSKSNKWENV